MKKVFLFILALVNVLYLPSCVITDNDIDNYYDDVKNYYAGSFMPDLKTMSGYTEAEYYSRKDNNIFPEYSLQLIVRYEEDNFIKEKERLEDAYMYLDEPRKLYDDNCYTIPVESFSISGYNFKIVNSADDSFPKRFGMIGISDEKYEIAYLWVYCPDLDYICESDDDRYEKMLEFVTTHFKLE